MKETAQELFERVDRFLERKGYSEADRQLLYYECGQHSTMKDEFDDIYKIRMKEFYELRKRKRAEERKRKIRQIFRKTQSISKTQEELSKIGICVSTRYISRIVQDIPRTKRTGTKGA